MFYKLNVNDFFDNKYEQLNMNSGIGAMGFITSKQSIHVYNDYGFDKKTNKDYLGLGDHIDITKKVLKEIYDIPDSLVDSYLYNLISIKYWNSEMYKIIAIYFPKIITLDEYKYLYDLQYYYKDVLDKYRITIGAYVFGDDVSEYGPDIQTTSDFEPIIKYAKNKLDTNLDRNIKERILRF